MSVHHLDNATDSPAKVQRCDDPLNADVWTVVLSHVNTCDVPRMALVCRAFHTATLSEGCLFGLFVNAAQIDDAIAVCMLACTATSLATLDRMLAVPRTRAVEPAEMPWMWTAVLRRLVCRQPRERPGCRLALHAALPRWQELVDRLESRVVVAPCLFLSASLAGNAAIIRAYARAQNFVDFPSNLHSIVCIGITVGGLFVAQTLESVHEGCTSYIPGYYGSAFHLDNNFGHASVAAWSYRDSTIDRFLPLWHENGILELLCVAMALGDMTLVRACCRHLGHHGDLDENICGVLQMATVYGHHEAMRCAVSTLNDGDKDLGGFANLNDMLRCGDHFLSEHIVEQRPFDTTLRHGTSILSAVESRNPMCLRVVCEQYAPMSVPRLHRLGQLGRPIGAPMLDEMERWGLLQLAYVQNDADFVAWVFEALDEDELIARVLDRYHIAGAMLGRVCEACSLRVAVRLAAQDPLDAALANFVLPIIVPHVQFQGAAIKFPAGVPLRSLVSLCDAPELADFVAAYNAHMGR